MRLLVAWLLPLARGAFDGDARFEAACAAPARRRFAVMACACTNEGPSSPTQHLGAMGELARATALGDMLAAALPRGADGGRAADAVLLLSGYYSDARVSPRDAAGRFTVSRSPGPRAPRSGHERRGFWGAAGPMAGMRVLNSTTLTFDGRHLDLGRWDRLVAVDRSTLHFAVKSERSDAYRDTFWNSERMQERSDGQCTSMKIFAWRFTAYDGVLLLDSDVCPLSPLAPFLHRACDAGVAFLASNERRRGVSYLGLNSHMVWLRPDLLIFEVLRDKAALGDFMTYTNGEQDVLETLFSPHANERYLERVGGLPEHVHRKTCAAKEGGVAIAVRDAGARAPAPPKLAPAAPRAPPKPKTRVDAAASPREPRAPRAPREPRSRDPPREPRAPSEPRSPGEPRPRDARAPLPREPLAPSYRGYYCDASDRKCHTASGKCWAARACDPGVDRGPRDRPAADKVFLYHMRKAGGTTLHAHLKRRCRAYDTVEWFSPDTPRAKNAFRLSSFREPVARAVSAYVFEGAAPACHAGEAAGLAPCVARLASVDAAGFPRWLEASRSRQAEAFDVPIATMQSLEGVRDCERWRRAPWGPPGGNRVCDRLYIANYYVKTLLAGDAAAAAACGDARTAPLTACHVGRAKAAVARLFDCVLLVRETGGGFRAAAPNASRGACLDGAPPCARLDYGALEPWSPEGHQHAVGPEDAPLAEKRAALVAGVYAQAAAIEGLRRENAPDLELWAWLQGLPDR